MAGYLLVIINKTKEDQQMYSKMHSKACIPPHVCIPEFHTEFCYLMKKKVVLLIATISYNYSEGVEDFGNHIFREIISVEGPELESATKKEKKKKKKKSLDIRGNIRDSPL